MNPKKLREQAVKDAKCSLILDAAKKVFAEKGYVNAHLEDIAAAAGFSKPTLYSYYPDKAAIFINMSIRDARLICARIEGVIESTGPFVETLEAILRIIFENFGRTFAYFSSTSLQSMSALHMEMSRHDELVQEYRELAEKIIALFEQLIRRGRERSEISNGTDPVDLSWFIVSLIQGANARIWMTGEAGDIESTIRQVVEFIKHGAGVSGA